MNENYEKVELILTIVGAAISAIVTILYLISCDNGIGKTVVLALLSFLFGASIVITAMSNINDMSESIGMGILLIVIMPFISLLETYAFLFIWNVISLIIKVFSIFGWATFGIIAAILIGIFFYFVSILLG